MAEADNVFFFNVFTHAFLGTSTGHSLLVTGTCIATRDNHPVPTNLLCAVSES